MAASDLEDIIYSNIVTIIENTLIFLEVFFAVLIAHKVQKAQLKKYDELQSTYSQNEDFVEYVER